MAHEKTTVMILIGTREVEMRQPSDGALVALAKVSRGMPKTMIENPDDVPQEMRDRLVRNLGTLGTIIESMVVTEDDRDWLEDAMISAEVDLEEVLDSIRKVAEKFNGITAAAKKTAAPVRRRR